MSGSYPLLVLLAPCCLARQVKAHDGIQGLKLSKSPGFSWRLEGFLLFLHGTSKVSPSRVTFHTRTAGFYVFWWSGPWPSWPSHQQSLLVLSRQPWSLVASWDAFGATWSCLTGWWRCCWAKTVPWRSKHKWWTHQAFTQAAWQLFITGLVTVLYFIPTVLISQYRCILQLYMYHQYSAVFVGLHIHRRRKQQKKK